MCGGEVSRLADVVAEVVEFSPAGVGPAVARFTLHAATGGFHKLPVALPQRQLRAEPPVEGLVRIAVVLTGHIGEKVHAVECGVGGQRDAGGRQRCGQDVELDHRPILDSARGDALLPLHEERHANPSLPRLRLEPAEGAIAGGD